MVVFGRIGKGHGVFPVCHWTVRRRGGNKSLQRNAQCRLREGSFGGIPKPVVRRPTPTLRGRRFRYRGGLEAVAGFTFGRRS